MDVASPAMNLATTTPSPPAAPPRPAIPPKPDKDRISMVGSKSIQGIQPGLPRRNSSADPTTISSSVSPLGNPHSVRPLAGEGSEGIKSQIPKSSSAVLSPPSTPREINLNANNNQGSPGRKPALPPKPSPQNLSSPPLANKTKKSLPTLPTDSVDNARFLNENSSTTQSVLNGETNVNTNGGIRSPPPFLRAKPPTPREPLSPRLGPQQLFNSRPNSGTFFNVSSPIQNLNSANFPSTSNGLNHNPGGFIPPAKRAEIRAKSASLGRNFNFPFSSPNSESGGGVRGIIQRKSATLAKFLPLDLHIGNRNSAPPSNFNNINRPKPNSLNLNPFIIQQQQRQQPQMSQNQVLSFGKSIAFSPDSPLPPPPPPRLNKKKLSPVNSLSPTSPTSPTVTFASLTTPNNSQLPPPPEENGTGAIYAEINMEKKWAERKLKAERKMSNEGSEEIPPLNQVKKLLKVYDKSDNSSQQQNNNIKTETVETLAETQLSLSSVTQLSFLHCNTNENKICSSECSENDKINENKDISDHTPPANNNSSFLSKYMSPVDTEQNKVDQIRSETPTYHSKKTGHIYETIGECGNQVGFNNDNNNHNKCHKNEDGNEQCKEEAVVENQSFLFKFVLGQNKSELTVETSQIDNQTDPLVQAQESSQTDETPTNGKEEEDKAVVVPLEVIPPPPPPRLFQLNNLQQNKEAGESHPLITSILSQTEANGDDISEEFLEASELNTVTLLEAINEQLTGIKLPPTSSGEDPNEDDMRLPPIDYPTAPESIGTTPSRNSSILRRRSWNSETRMDSPSFSDSSSVTSSTSYLSFQRGRRDRSSYASSNKGGTASNRDSLLSREDWVDEGDLSNGVLADAESSDAAPHPSSVEDLRGNSGLMGISPSSSNSNNSKSFGTRRSRIVNSLFGSFGKGSSSSGGSSGEPGLGKRSSVMRNSTGSSGKNKREKSNIFFSPPNSSSTPKKPLSHQGSSVSQWGRQISDSILPTTMISGPILPKSVSLGNNEMTQQHQQKSLSVQFSSQVSETHVYNESSEDCENASPSQPLPIPPSTSSLNDDSVSSSESVSGCGSRSGSISGYEDILSSLSPKETKAFYVAREILTSERTFVDVLKLLTVDFPNALSIASKYHGAFILSKEDLEKILGGLPTLKGVNEDLLVDLEERIRNWREKPKIADILVKKGPFLKLYATYIKDFQKNTAYLDTCCQKYPLFAAALKDFEASDKCSKLGLRHYMLKPVQRMPQYSLLLEQYLGTLDEESEDYIDTKKGIAIVKDVAEHANEAIRLQVNAEKLLQLQNRLALGTVILKADRQLIKEGELKKASRKELQPRFLALMNDCLLCFIYHAAAGSPKDLRLRYELPLAGMRVSLPSAEDHKFEFTVRSVIRSFNLVASSSRERDDWMKALNDAINDNIKKRTCSTPDLEVEVFKLGKEAPVWTQDSRVTMCQQCTAEFTMTFRRHHCRACGKVVCSNCSGNKAPLQYMKDESCRVCDSCYEYLLEEFDKLSNFSANESDTNKASLRDRFKKETPNVSKRATKIKRVVPSRLEVNANNSGSKVSGYLQWRQTEKKSWKKRWFVLMERVLYVYAASEDIVAMKSVPLLGWKIEMDKSETSENGDENQVIFKLTHSGSPTMLFQTDSMTTAEKWMSAMNEAVVL